MPYENTTAQFRPELQIKVEEAMEIDNKFIADYIFPIYPVQTRKGYYKRIKRGKGQLLSNPGKVGPDDPLRRAPGTGYPEVTRATEQDSWLCVDRGIEEALDDVNKQDEARFFDVESSTVIWLMRQMRIAREARVAALINNETIWGPAIPAPLAYTPANIDSIDPAELIKEGKRLVDKRQESPNTMVLSAEMWDLISGAKKFREFFFGTAGGSAMITRDMVAEKFELEQILVGRASYDTTRIGKDSTDANLVWTWGNTYIWIGNVQGGAPEMGGAGRTFVLEALTDGQLFVTESYRDERIRSDRIRIRQDDDTKVVNETAGVLLKINNLS